MPCRLPVLHRPATRRRRPAHTAAVQTETLARYGRSQPQFTPQNGRSQIGALLLFNATTPCCAAGRETPARQVERTYLSLYSRPCRAAPVGPGYCRADRDSACIGYASCENATAGDGVLVRWAVRHLIEHRYCRAAAVSTRTEGVEAGEDRRAACGNRPLNGPRDGDGDTE